MPSQAKGTQKMTKTNQVEESWRVLCLAGEDSVSTAEQCQS